MPLVPEVSEIPEVLEAGASVMAVNPTSSLLLLSVYVRARSSLEPSHARCGYPLAGASAILCTGGPGVIRMEAWPFYRTISGVRLCWELEEPKGPKGTLSTKGWK